jgi:hypothetical protein
MVLLLLPSRWPLLLLLLSACIFALCCVDRT